MTLTGYAPEPFFTLLMQSRLVFAIFCMGCASGAQEDRVDSESSEKGQSLLTTSIMPTTLFGEPKPLDIATDDWPAYPRPFFVDWDHDAALDILVAKGGGVWLYRNTSNTAIPQFESPTPLHAGGIPIAVKNDNAATILIDITGDDTEDLVIAENQSLRIYTGIENEASSHVFQADGIGYPLPRAIQSRIDVGDLNHDGLIDLVLGSYTGNIAAVLNTGNKATPNFSSRPVALTDNGLDKAEPCLYDFNRDGQLDLVFGNNKHQVEIRFISPIEPLGILEKSDVIVGENDNAFDIQAITRGQEIIDFSDLNRDGILDMIIAAESGQLFLSLGQSVRSIFSPMALKATPQQWIQTMAASDGVVRSDFVRRIDLLRKLSGSQIMRKAVKTQLTMFMKSHREILGFMHYDNDTEAPMPTLLASLWSLVLSLTGETEPERTWAANALGIPPGVYRRIFKKFGVLVVDNMSLQQNQLEFIYKYLDNIPRSVWQIQIITVKEFMGDPMDFEIKTPYGMCNIYAPPLGAPEGSFPSDAPYQDTADNFLTVLAHELNHQSFDNPLAKAWLPENNERKLMGLMRIAAPYPVIFREPYTQWIDWAQTQALWRENGDWDGIEEHWDAAWDAYFTTGGGKETRTQHLREHYGYFLKSPQEGFATLANPYFDNTLLMLETAYKRAQNGYLSNLDQFFLIAEYYTQKSETMTFYDFDPGGILTKKSAQLIYDVHGYIQTIDVDNKKFTFYRDDNGWVTGVPPR